MIEFSCLKTTKLRLKMMRLNYVRQFRVPFSGIRNPPEFRVLKNPAPHAGSPFPATRAISPYLGTREPIVTCHKIKEKVNQTSARSKTHKNDFSDAFAFLGNGTLTNANPSTHTFDFSTLAVICTL